jgi:hypothetical protein
LEKKCNDLTHANKELIKALHRAQNSEKDFARQVTEIDAQNKLLEKQIHCVMQKVEASKTEALVIQDEVGI